MALNAFNKYNKVSITQIKYLHCNCCLSLCFLDHNFYSHALSPHGYKMSAVSPDITSIFQEKGIESFVSGFQESTSFTIKPIQQTSASVSRPECHIDSLTAKEAE